MLWRQRIGLEGRGTNHLSHTTRPIQCQHNSWVEMWYLLANLQTSSSTSLLPDQRGNIQSPASVRSQEARGKVDKVLTIKTRTMGKEVEATDLPMARIGLTVSGRTQLANSAKNSTLPVAATRCHATKSTTAIADCVVVYSATRKHMGKPLMTTNIKHLWS